MITYFTSLISVRGMQMKQIEFLFFGIVSSIASISRYTLDQVYVITDRLPIHRSPCSPMRGKGSETNCQYCQYKHP